MRRQLFLFLLGFLLLFSLSFALEITSLEPKIGPYTVEYIAFRNPLTISIEVNISTDQPVISVHGDFSDLTQNPLLQDGQSNLEFSCSPKINNETEEQESVFCRTEGVQVQLTRTSAQVILTIENYDGEFELPFTMNFTQDTQGPVVSKIVSDYCVAERCYVASGRSTPIQIHVADPVGTMYLNRIFYRIGSLPTRMVFSCGEGVCDAFYAGACITGQSIPLEIATGPNGQPSSDDAGNAVTGQLKKNFICDQFSPGEKALPEEYSGLLPRISLSYPKQDGIFVNVKHKAIMPHPTKEETIVLWALVTEDISGVDAYLNTSALNGVLDLQKGTCSELTNQVFNCSWAITKIKEGEHTVYLSFYDRAGHQSRFSSSPTEFSSQLAVRIKVDDIILAETTETPKFFKDISATPLSTQGYNRIALQLAYENNIDYPLYASFTLQRSGIGGDIEAIQTFISEIDRYTCRIESSDKEKAATITPASFEFKFVKPTASINEKTNLFIKIREHPNNLPDDFNLFCNVSVIVRQDKNKVYEEPATFVLKIPLKLKNSALDGTPGKAFADKIIEQEEAILKWNDVMDTLGQTMYWANTICSYAQKLALVQTTGTAVETVGLGMNQVTMTKGMAPAVIRIGSGLQGFGSRTIGRANSQDSLFGKMCEYATCTNDGLFDLLGEKAGWLADGSIGGFDPIGYANDFLTLSDDDGFLAGLGKDFGNQLLANVSAPDSQNSIVGSVMNLCLPGVVLNLDKYRTIQCETLICYKQSALYGVDVSTCDLGRSTSICMNVVGEVYELVPYTRIWTNLMDNAGAMVESALPTVLTAVLGNLVCKSWEKNPPPPSDTIRSWSNLLLCKITKAVGDTVNQMEKSRGSFYYPPVQNHCQAALCNTADLTSCNYPTNTYYDFGNQKPLHMYWDDLSRKRPQEMDPYYNTKELGQIVDTIYENQVFTPDSKGKYTADYYNDLFGTTGQTFWGWNIVQEKGGFSDGDVNSDTGIAVFADRDLQASYLAYHQNVELFDDFAGIDLSNPENLDMYEKLRAIPPGLKFNKNDLKAYTQSDSSATIKGRDFELMVSDPKDYFKDYPIKDENGDVINFNRLSDEEQDMYIRERAEDLGFIDNLAEINFNKNLISGLEEQIRDTRRNSDLSDLEKEFALEVLQKQLDEAENNLEAASSPNAEALAPLNDAHTEITQEERAFLTDFVVNQLVSFAAKQGWLNWMKSSALFGEDNAVGNFADWLKNNVDNQKQFICDGGVSNSGVASSVPSGSAMQCSNELCRPVLTQAVERTDFKATVDGVPKDLYLYTIVYHLGNVRAPSAGSADEVMKFKVIFKQSRGTDVSLFEEDWQELSYGQSVEFKKPIISEEEYTSMCFVFERPFPPGEGVHNKLTYCRSIVVADRGATAFDTGVPVPKDYIANALAEIYNKNSGTSQTQQSSLTLNPRFSMNNQGTIVYN